MAGERDWMQVVARETCGECGLRASAPGRAQLAGALREVARGWAALLGEADAASLRRTAAPRRWSALEYGGHTAGLLAVFADRIEQSLVVDDPQLGWWDHEEAVVLERYDDRDPAATATLITAHARRLADVLGTLDGAMWDRTATRRPGERFTVEGLARFALHEAHHHLYDARSVLEAHGTPQPAPDRPGFARSFTEHMATARFDTELGWTETEIVGFGELPLSPAAMVFHYGQAVFEGLKAFRQPSGGVALFRPHQHAARFDRSARSLAMPELAPGAFVTACERLVRTEIDRVPSEPGHSLYLRPMLFASEAGLGVRPAAEYLFVVIASEVGSYFDAADRPLTVWVTLDHSRAVPGGTGSAKCSGNYAASLAAKQTASARGCDEVLWLDAIEHRWVEELSGMNVLFVAPGGRGPALVTPPVGGTILDGVTRRSLLHLAAGLGYQVVERPVSIGELTDSRSFVEAMACGTASGVTPIGTIRLDGGDYIVGDGRPGPVTLRLRQALLALQEGRAPGPVGWLVPVPSVAVPAT